MDPPLLEIQECSAADSPAELARFEYDPTVRSYEPFDLGHAFTVRLELRGGETEHYIVDNCGGEPLRLKDTLGYRAGAARVGGDIVACAGLSEYYGVRELLQDGSAGRELGLGYGCPERGHTTGRRTGVAAEGFVWTEPGVTQYLPDGRVRSLPLFGELTRVNATWFVHTVEGEIGILGPDGADPVVIDLPGEIDHVEAPADSSPWVTVSPDPKGEDYKYLYVLDTRDGSWFPTGLTPSGYQPVRTATRGGLAITYATGWNMIEFSRAQWDATVRTDLDLDAGFTVVDEEHVLTVDDREVRLLRIPLKYPGEDEAAYHVLWKYPVPDGESLAGSYPGMLWNDVVLLPLAGETWAFPIDGSEPYPFLPNRLEYTYFGSEFVTAIVDDILGGDRDQLVRRALDGELEVLAEGVLDFQARPWTPQLGRILYAVRDGEHVSIRQHRLTD